ncbi:ABC transporter substrate-binding protein [Xanthobacter oligotrophicus]|uniref:ABC transporter substrate-binding protein n=1 Tax=Xanthobacter oligotrophicus TaxID=2607286 RepID=UPI0011F0B9CD|nr:ABC transporter substrate-binding protein [Xanthobacter oligotrophicus]MCG5234487.1 ABC transporter substrate-binding protein [Xanthobacter oligotrophicus]
MDRRSLLALGLGAGAAGLAGRLPGAHGQSVPSGPAASGSAAAPRAEPFRVLMLTFRGDTDVERGFRDYFAANEIKVEFLTRDVERDAGRVKPILAEVLPVFKPDLIYTYGTPNTLAVAGPYDAPPDAPFVHDIPVVFALVAAPVQVKIAPSLASSGRNVTGAVHVVPTDVQMRAMQSYKAFRKVGVIYSPNERNSVAIIDEMKAFCAGIDASVIAQPLTMVGSRPTGDGVEDFVRNLKAQGADWLYLPADTFLATIFDRVGPAALAAGLPTFGATEFFLREGLGLVGLVSRYYSVGQLAASKAVEVLVQRVPPRDIPIETLRRFALIINMNIAKQLGVYPPIAMLNYAEVIT